MNIAFVKLDISIKGGSERVACLLMNELSKVSGYNIYCLTYNFKNKKIAYELNSNIEVEVLAENKRLRYSFFSIFRKMKDYIQKKNIDIIINIGTGESIVSSFLKIIFRKKIKIITCEHSNLLNLYVPKQKKIAQFIGSICSDKIVTLTKRDKENFKKIFKLKYEKIESIYNFIDEKLLASKNEYNLKGKKIISVGRLVDVKGFDRLIKIAAIAFKDEKIKDWEWHIYGDGPEKEKLEKMIRKYNLEKKVILKGNVENIYEIYKEYSFYVMTSYFEGLPMVLLEAKANSLPIISFDINTGPSEIVRNNIDGYLIQDGDLKEISSKIIELAINDDTRKKFSLNAKENLDKFSKKKIIKKWIKLLEEIDEIK